MRKAHGSRGVGSRDATAGAAGVAPQPGVRSNTVQYALLPAVLSPLVLAAVWCGPGWAIGYLLLAIATFIVLDELAPPLAAATEPAGRRLYDAFLLAQLPLSSALIGVMLVALGTDAPVARSVTEHLGLSPAAQTSGWSVLALGVVCGFHLGTNFAVAHELMHRQPAALRACSRYLLVLVGDAHFQEAHLYGHHAHLGTARDPASARRGESLYHFLVRSTLGQLREAYRFERRRLSQHTGLGFWLRHAPLRGNAGSLALLLGAGMGFGARAMAGYALTMLVAKVMLENINYIQHYGLERSPREPIGVMHSWESTGRGSALVLFNLTRHADHHQLPRKPYWALENIAASPQMGHGFIATLFLALIPPIWFRHADRRISSGSLAAPSAG